MIAAGRKSNTSRTASQDRVGVGVLGAERVELHRHGMRGADRVRDLELRAVREAGGDDVLGDVARHVRGRTIDLGRVLAAERAPAVRRHAAVGVDDDLAAGEARVGLGPADLEPAGRVDERRLPVARRARGTPGAPGRSPPRSMSGLSSVSTSTSSRCWARDQDGVDAHGLAVRVLDGDLALAVGSQVRNDARLADVGQPLATAGGPSRSAAASALRSRGTRSRTSSPGRPRRGCRARRRSDPRDARGRRRRRARCRPTAPGSRSRRRRSRRRARTWRPCSRHP